MLKEGSKMSINSLTEDENTTMMSLSGVKRFPMRVKCATLAWHTFIHAAEGKEETAVTE
jgi:NifU homolog involved in Fe-S cluster formation